MSIVTSAISRAIRRNPGLSWIAAAISIVIVAMAAATLCRVFGEIEYGRVIAALRAQSLGGLVRSGGFVVGGYLALICYDVFALRAIGRKDVSYKVAALASFTSYTVGHNFGAAIFTSGVIRYRIYSTWDLSVKEIARIAFITGLTYWLGNAFVLGSSVALAPNAARAIDHLPVPVNRLIGIAALAVLSGYLLWLLPGPRSVGRSNWRIALPNLPSTLVQIAIGSLDLICVALAMYALLPAQPAIAFFDLLVIFVTAMLIGVVSYVPGNLGVLEAAMFIGLPQFSSEALLASLVTFRVLYFVLPLLLAVLLLGVREVRSLAAGIGHTPAQSVSGRK
jgi:glycosyltransferase 2 family protein